MTLSKAILEAELLKIFDPPAPQEDNFSQSILEFAAAFTAAYDAYAKTNAEDASGDNPISVNSSLMKTELSKLKSGDDALSATAADAAVVYADSWVKYWTGAVFGIISIGTTQCANVGGNGIFSSEISSAVIAVVKTTLESALKTEFEDLGASSDNPKTAAQAASNLAQIFHDATTTGITVLITGLDTTAPTPLPITNTCQVF